MNEVIAMKLTMKLFNESQDPSHPLYDPRVYPDEIEDPVSCIGNGTKGAGCGYTGGKSGGTCPKCGGMLLSESSLKAADKLAEIWTQQPTQSTSDETIKVYDPEAAEPGEEDEDECL